MIDSFWCDFWHYVTFNRHLRRQFEFSLIYNDYKCKGFFHDKRLCLSGNEEQLILYVNVNKEMNRTEDQ